MKQDRTTKKIAFCGIIAALILVLMFLSGLIPIATIAIPAIAGCLLIAVVVEAGISWGFTVYAVCSVLSMILATDKEAALFFVLFFGYYPVLFAVLCKMKNKLLRYFVKLLIFNSSFLLELWLSINLLGIPFEAIEMLGSWSLPVLLIMANIVFVIYDYALNGLIHRYIHSFHNKIQRIFKI